MGENLFVFLAKYCSRLIYNKSTAERELKKKTHIGQSHAYNECGVSQLFVHNVMLL